MRQSSRGVMPQRPSHNNSKKNIFVCLGCVLLCVTFDSSFFMSYFRTFTNKRNQTYYSLTYEASVLSIDYIGENKIQATKYLNKLKGQHFLLCVLFSLSICCTRLSLFFFFFAKTAKSQ